MGPQKEQRTAVSRVDFYFEDWLTGASELTPEQRGVYITLCALYYSKQGKVMENDRRLAGICDLSVRKWRTIKSELVSLDKISFIDGLLYHERCEIELVNALKAKAAAQENGSKGGKKSAEIRANMLKRNKAGASAAASEADTEVQAGHEPPFPPPSPLVDSPPIPPQGGGELSDEKKIEWEDKFIEFKSEYPAMPVNPWGPAKEEFRILVGEGVEPDDIVFGAIGYRYALTDEGAPKPCTARIFLREKRYEDYAAEEAGPVRRAPTEEEGAAWMDAEGKIPATVSPEQPWPWVWIKIKSPGTNKLTNMRVPYPESKNRDDLADDMPPFLRKTA